MSDIEFSFFEDLYMSMISPKLPGFSQNYAIFTEPTVIERLWKISQNLLRNAKKFNLTSITEPREVVKKHIIDSLIPLGLILEEGIAPESVLDVGTGAGFPLLPMAAVLKDALPRTTLVGLDATQKKISHINETASFAALSRVSTINGRAEDLGRGKNRGKFDLTIARAVAPLPVLLELCAPFVSLGGVFAALKSHADCEIADAEAAADALSMTKLKKIDYELPGGDIRCLILYRKTAPTLMKYPRLYAEITKHPIKREAAPFTD